VTFPSGTGGFVDVPAPGAPRRFALEPRLPPARVGGDRVREALGRNASMPRHLPPTDADGAIVGRRQGPRADRSQARVPRRCLVQVVFAEGTLRPATCRSETPELWVGDDCAGSVASRARPEGAAAP
jgi:hypothetical protein